MYLDKRDINSEECIAQCHTCVSKGRRIDQDKVHTFFAGIVDAFDQFVFRIALQVQEVVPGIVAQLGELLVDGIQRCRSVNPRLAQSEQVKVGAVKYQNGSHGFG